MSKHTFDHRPRANLNSTGNEKWTYQARAGGFVMAKSGRQRPVIFSEKEWAKLPLWEKEQT